MNFMLISQITPVMFIVAKTKGNRHGLKGECILVLADLEKRLAHFMKIM